MFKNRAEAGRRLAGELEKKKPANPVVLCIPRGGVLVGAEVAAVLKAPLDLIVPRKLGAPFNPEVAIGAVAQDGTTYFNKRLISSLGIGRDELDGLIEKEVREIERRMTGYRGSTEYADFSAGSLILVDDGAATGYTMLAAAEYARKTLRTARLIIAVPVAPPETLELFGRVTPEVVCLQAPAEFYAVGQFYQHFDQNTDEEVLSVLTRFAKPEKG